MSQKVLGTAQLARMYGISRRTETSLSRIEAIRMLKEAEELGFSAIDTAPVYGQAEKLVGMANLNIQIHTKLDPGLTVKMSIDNSLSNLQTEALDLVYVHDFSAVLAPNSTVIDELNELKGQKLKRIGVSIYQIDEFAFIEADSRIDVIQVPFNVFDQRFSLLQSQQTIGDQRDIFARSLFLQGLLLLEIDQYPEAHRNLVPYGLAFDAIARKHGISRLEAAIGFAQAQSHFSGLIFGIDSPKDLREISNTCDFLDFHSVIVSELQNLTCPNFELVDPRLWQA